MNNRRRGRLAAVLRSDAVTTTARRITTTDQLADADVTLAIHHGRLYVTHSRPGIARTVSP